MNARMAHMGAVLTLAAGFVMSSEPLPSEEDSPQGSEEPSEDLIQGLETLSDDDKQGLVSVLTTFLAGTTQLVQGQTNEKEAQFVARNFLDSDETEWWRCDESTRFILDGGCGEDGCPVTLAANLTMLLGRVTFAGSVSYSQYGIRGLERRWNWCLDDDDSFGCAFVLQAGGDGSYYDFAAPSTNTQPDGSQVARPAGSFKCERFSSPAEGPQATPNEH